MADVQLENGFTRVAHDLMQALISAKLSEREKSVILSVMTHTYGRKGSPKVWPIGAAAIATDLGVDLREAKRLVAQLVSKGVLMREPRGRKAAFLGVQKDHERWQCETRARGDIHRGYSGGRAPPTVGGKSSRLSTGAKTASPQSTGRTNRVGGVHPPQLGGADPPLLARRQDLNTKPPPEHTSEAPSEIGGGLTPEQRAEAAAIDAELRAKRARLQLEDDLPRRAFAPGESETEVRGGGE